MMDMQALKFTKSDYLSSLFKSLLPSGLAESAFFVLCFFSYYSLGFYIAMTTAIIDKKDTYDMYFSFDNSYKLYFGSEEHATHPLTEIFYWPVRLVYDLIIRNSINEKYFTYFVVLLCSFFVAASVFLVFKYLRNIIKLNKAECYLLSVFYASFGGCVFLSFTPETFTFSLFVLTLNIYVVSYYLSLGKELNSLYYIIAATIIGGQTITNAPKVIIPVIFENKSIKKKIIKMMICSVFVTFLILLSWRFDVLQFIMSNLTRAGDFSAAKFSLFDSFVSYFFGGNILLPSMRVDKSIWVFIKTPGIYLNVYNGVYLYLIVFLIFILIIISSVKNYKNKLVAILLLSFAGDLFYHFVLRIGLLDSFIFGGHFIFLIPMLLGWLYTNITEKQRGFLSYLLTFVFVIVLVNNVFRVYQFIDLAKYLYPISK